MPQNDPCPSLKLRKEHLELKKKKEIKKYSPTIYVIPASNEAIHVNSVKDPEK